MAEEFKHGDLHGSGTKDDPLWQSVAGPTGRLRGRPTNGKVVQCIVCGKWFSRGWGNQRNCYACKPIPPRRYRKPKTPVPKEIIRSFDEIIARLQKFVGPPEPTSDGDKRTEVDFGGYGPIVCSFRERGVARLLALDTPVWVAATFYDYHPAQVLEMLDGGGAQPKLTHMMHHYAQTDAPLVLKTVNLPKITEALARASGEDKSGKEILPLLTAWQKLVGDFDKTAPERLATPDLDFKPETDADINRYADQAVRELVESLPATGEKKGGRGPRE